MKNAFRLLLVFCLVTAAHAQTLTLKELYGFSCPSQFANCPQGKQPDALILASDGNFYGAAQATTPPVEAAGGGAIFKMTPSGQLTVLYTFTENPSTGFYPNGEGPASIAEGSDGLLYGVAEAGGPTAASAGTLFRLHKDGTGFQVLQNYCTTCANGGFPTFIMAAGDGNLYGTTSSGGIIPPAECEGLGCGVVFRLTTGGVYTVLHRFNGTTESSYPIGLTQASDGNLYGTTAYEGGGTIFKVTSSGVYSTLVTFPGNAYGLAAPTQASDGMLYGFSHVQSAATVELYNCTLSGSLLEVAQITQPLFKQYGLGQVLQASDGNLWTAAAAGGAGWGRVFSVTTKGAIVDSLNFSGTNGSFATGPLVQTQNGTLYGTTIKGGTTSSGGAAYGEIYTITGLPAR